MLKTCSSSRIIDEIINEVKIICRDCLSLEREDRAELSQRYTSKLVELNKLEQEYLDNCYYGSLSDEEVLMWIELARRIIKFYLGLEKGMTAELVRLIASLIYFMERNANQLVLELERRTTHAKIIKELFLAGIQDKAKSVSDEKIRLALNVMWGRVFHKIKDAIEKYVTSKGLLETALKIDLLNDEGLRIDRVFIDLLKSEIDNVLLRIERTRRSVTPSMDVAREIIGAVKRIVLLYDVSRSLKGEELEYIKDEIAKLKESIPMFEMISTYDTMGISGFLGDLAELLSQIKGFLQR